MDPLATSLFVDMARRREQLAADLAAFRTAHASQRIDDLTPQESRELFAILLANGRLDCELRTLDKVVARLLDMRGLQ
jgi:hypothetical protein